jgi:hypothetical protein
MNKEEVLAAVSQSGYALMGAPPALKADKDVVLAAVSQNGIALMIASPAMRADKDVVLAAVSQNPGALMYTSPEMKEDKEVVLAAVSQYGGALMIASPELKADPEVVLAAISQNGHALMYASPVLRGSPEILWRASKKGYTPTPEERELIQHYVDSRKATVMPLLATTRRAPPYMAAARTQDAIARVNAHGPIFGDKFKRLTAAFAGVSGGRRRKTKRRKRK